MVLFVFVLSSSLFEEYNSYPPPELVRSNRGKDPSLSSPPSIIPLLDPIFDVTTKNEELFFFFFANDSLFSSLLLSSSSADKEEALKLPKSSVDLYGGEDEDDGILIVILPGNEARNLSAS